MAALPTGTVTFLFTDLEGSTRLWQGHPDVMKSALARHDELIRAAVESRGGVVVKTTGDGVHAAFATAEDGVLAAVDAQRSLVAVPWPETGPPRVRMGEPEAALSAARRAWEQAVVVGARTSFGQSLGIAFLTLADLKRWEEALPLQGFADVVFDGLWGRGPIPARPPSSGPRLRSARHGWIP